MGRVIGIDLGTTNCCMALLEDGRAQVIALQDGARLMPSVVAFTEQGEVLVGQQAKRQAALNPNRTVYGAKRLMGRKFDDPRIQQWNKLVPYTIAAADNGDARVDIDGRLYSPEQLASYLLAELKRNAEEFLGEPVSSATVTVPAYFNDRQRQATKDAGRMAQLNVEHILNEPTAAALAFGATQGDDETLCVFDLGGGTFDVTILKKAGVLYEVQSTHGDTFLGGEDFDGRLLTHLAKYFDKQHGYDLTADGNAMQRVKEAAETAKRVLSGSESVAINLPFLAQQDGQPLHLHIESFRRANLEALCTEVIQSLEEPCYRALDGAGLPVDAIDRVLLAGGMTRMPAVRRKVRQIFEREPEHQINPDEIVALGAAAQSGILTGELTGVTLLDVTPHSLGVRVNDDDMRVLVPKNTTVPVAEERSFSTTVDGQQVVTIHVYQGESAQASSNTHLGEFRLVDLPKASAGELEIVVTFLLDADGILHVSASEQQSGQEAKVEIRAAGGLTEREVHHVAAS